jgi:hypothetical protein
LRFLFERMRILERQMAADSKTAAQFSSAVLELGKFISASLPTEQLTTFIGANPWLPTLDVAAVSTSDGFSQLGDLSTLRIG